MDTAANSSSLVDVAPYSVIAKGYDFIMAHVDYEQWAIFTDHLLWQYHKSPQRILELGCGTGSFALELQPLGEYDYTGSDLCPEMIAEARRKAQADGYPIKFLVDDFSQYSVKQPYDVVILLYDGLNYLLEEERIVSLFKCTFEALEPGGIFFFDQSTPANSINNEAFFSDEGEMDGFSYVRGSKYDQKTQLHTTTFEIQHDGRTVYEEHVQRAYKIDLIRTLLLDAGFKIEVAFDGFSSKKASEASERVHWLARKP